MLQYYRCAERIKCCLILSSFTPKMMVVIVGGHLAYSRSDSERSNQKQKSIWSSTCPLILTEFTSPSLLSEEITCNGHNHYFDPIQLPITHSLYGSISSAFTRHVACCTCKAYDLIHLCA